MSNPYRALCAELIEAVLSDDSHIDCVQIARRARALLAQPVPEGSIATEHARTQEINDLIAETVYGPEGSETPACANAWEVSKLIASLQTRVKALEALDD